MEFYVSQTSQNGKKEAVGMSTSVILFSLPLVHSSPQGKEAQSASVSAKGHISICPPGCSDRILPQQRHKMLETEKQKLESFVADSHP